MDAYKPVLRPTVFATLALLAVGCGVGSESDPTVVDSSVKGTVHRIPNVPPYSLAFWPDDKTLAAASDDSIHLYQIASGQELPRARFEHEAPGRGEYLAYSPDGRHLVSGHRNGMIGEPNHRIYLREITSEGRIREVATLLESKPNTGHVTTVYHVGFSPDGKTVISGSADGTVYLWETATGKERLRFPGGVAAAFSADGKTVIAVSHDGEVSRWDAVTGKVIGAGPAVKRNDFIHTAQVAFAPGAGMVAVLDGYMVSLREAATGRQVCRLIFPGEVSCPVMSPDGRVLAVQSDGGHWFFNGITGQLRGWRKGHGAGTISADGKYIPLVSGTISADGKYIALVEDGTVVVRELSEVLAGLSKPPIPTLTDHPGTPLEAELIATQDTYALDLGGRTPGEFSQQIVGDGWPPRPSVDLIFRVRNTSNQKLKMGFLWGPSLFLTGEGAINLTFPSQIGVGGGGPDPVFLAPGESYDFPVSSVKLNYGGVSYWLLPGEYTVHAQYSTSIAPAPKGAKAEDDGSAWITVRSPPLKLKVVEAKR